MYLKKGQKIRALRPSISAWFVSDKRVAGGEGATRVIRREGRHGPF